ncbi:hypothetical protein CSUI_005928, partial [Cystoisospora suis]
GNADGRMLRRRILQLTMELTTGRRRPGQPDRFRVYFSSLLCPTCLSRRSVSTAL